MACNCWHSPRRSTMVPCIALCRSKRAPIKKSGVRCRVLRHFPEKPKKVRFGVLLTCTRYAKTRTMGVDPPTDQDQIPQSLLISPAQDDGDAQADSDSLTFNSNYPKRFSGRRQRSANSASLNRPSGRYPFYGHDPFLTLLRLRPWRRFTSKE